MTSKKSSFNFSRMFRFFKANVKKSKGLALMYFLLSVVFMIFPYVSEVIRYLENPDYNSLYLLGHSQTFTSTSGMFFPVIHFSFVITFAIYLFSYLQSKKAVDVYHTFPITRKEMYLANMLCALSYIIVNLLFNFTVIGIISAVINGSVNYFWLSILEALILIVLSFAVFTVSAFACINVGTVLDSIMYTVVLLFGFTTAFFILVMFSEYYIEGFYSSYNLFELSLSLSPITVFYQRIILYSHYFYGITQSTIFSEILTVAIWTAVSVFLTWLNMFIYKKRKSEIAGTVGNMGVVQIISRTLVALIFGIILGQIISGVMRLTDDIQNLICTFVATLIVYAVMELILSRNPVRIIKNFHSSLLTSLFVTAVFGVIITGLFGYESYVPKSEDVKTVEVFSSDFEDYYGNDDLEGYLTSNGLPVAIFEEKESIQDVINVHEIIIANSINTNIFDEDTFYISMEIAYHMNDGSVNARKYNVNVPTEYKDVFIALSINDEIIENYSLVNHLEESNITGVSVATYYDPENREYLDLGEDLPTALNLVEALKEDMKAETVEQYQEGSKSVYVLNFDIMYQVNYNDKIVEETSTYQVEVYEHYENTLKILEALSVENFVEEIAPDDIAEIILMDEYYSISDLINYSMEYYHIYSYELENYIENGVEISDTTFSSSMIKIDDPKSFYEEHQENLYTRHSSENIPYTVIIEKKDGTRVAYFIGKEHVELPSGE